MRVEPLKPVEPFRQPPHRRAQMMIHGKKHTVVDSYTGDKFDLPAEQAWEKLAQINCSVDIIV